MGLDFVRACLDSACGRRWRLRLIEDETSWMLSCWKMHIFFDLGYLLGQEGGWQTERLNLAPSYSCVSKHCYGKVRLRLGLV